jgi:hypothetical protein
MRGKRDRKTPRIRISAKEMAAMEERMKQYPPAEAMLPMFYEALPSMTNKELSNYFSSLAGVCHQVYRRVKQDVIDGELSDEPPMRVTWWLKIMENSAEKPRIYLEFASQERYLL